MQDEPVGGPPIALSPPTYGRHEAATRYVEGVIRTRAPRIGRERFPGASWSAWGRLVPGDSITGRVGLTLGEGDVELCLPPVYGDPEDLAGSGEMVHVYNAGGPIAVDSYGVDLVIPLVWRHGFWSVGSASSGAFVIPAKSQSDGVPARVDDAPGTATVDVYRLQAGGLTDTMEDAGVFNIAGSPVEPNTYLLLMQDIDGNLWVIVEDCGTDVYGY